MSTQSLKGKKAMVIGGSRGIGAAVVKRLAREGAAVAFTYLSSRAAAEALATSIEDAGGHATALHADSATQLVELFEEARFSPHVMNEGHRDVAVDALRLVLTELRSMA